MLSEVAVHDSKTMRQRALLGVPSRQPHGATGRHARKGRPKWFGMIHNTCAGCMVTGASLDNAHKGCTVGDVVTLCDLRPLSVVNQVRVANWIYVNPYVRFSRCLRGVLRP